MHGHRHRAAHPCDGAVGLDEVPPGSCAIICALEGDEAFRERLRTMGLREGEPVEVIKQAPLADPREYRVGCVHLSLRQREACLVRVGQVHETGRPDCRRRGGGGWGWGRWGRGRSRCEG